MVWRNPEELRMELAGLGSIQPYASLCYMSKGSICFGHAIALRLCDSVSQHQLLSHTFILRHCRSNLLTSQHAVIIYNSQRFSHEWERVSPGDEARTRNFQLGNQN